MIEFDCPACGHHNALPHGDCFDYRTECDMESSCEECGVAILFDCAPIPEVWNVRALPEPGVA